MRAGSARTRQELNCVARQWGGGDNMKTLHAKRSAAAHLTDIAKQVHGRETRIAEMLGLLSENGSPDTGSCGGDGKSRFR